MESLRELICRIIVDKYGAAPERLWSRYPNYTVFRRNDNKKWFAVIMNVQKNKLGLSGDESVDILNVKCDSFLVSLLIDEDGFLPAYHQNKKNWITILLDNSRDIERIEELIETSFQATKRR